MNILEKLEEEDGATMFFLGKKQQKAIRNCSLDSLVVAE